MPRTYMEKKICDIIVSKYPYASSYALDIARDIIELIKAERDLICTCYYKAETKCYAKKEKK